MITATHYNRVGHAVCCLFARHHRRRAALTTGSAARTPGASSSPRPTGPPQARRDRSRNPSRAGPAVRATVRASLCRSAAASARRVSWMPPSARVRAGTGPAASARPASARPRCRRRRAGRASTRAPKRDAPHAEARVADAVRHPPAQRRPLEGEEPGGGVDRPAPPVREPQAGELRERVEEVLRQQLEGLRALVELVAQSVTPVVDAS